MREFDWLTKRWEQEQARQDRGMALLLQRVLSYTQGKHDQPIRFDDILSALGHRPTPPPPPPVKSPEELRQTIEMLHGFYSVGNTNGQQGG